MMQQIASFSVDHDKIVPGMYISRIDGDITTFDLRTRTPNSGAYMDNVTMHTVEHMLATLLRNGPIKEHVIYFGPMGCQTGFYLLTRSIDPATVQETLICALRDVLTYEGPVYGATRKECGNYQSLSLESAKRECRSYLAVLQAQKGDFSYAE